MSISDEKTQTIIGKLDQGDGLNDQELILALEWYQDLEHKLWLLGERYRLAWEPVMRRRMDLEGFKKARQEDRAR